jgi:very-short-patch-repair endonuclease
MRGANERRTGRSRSLRRSSTRAELALWRQLRDRQLGGFKFVRQEPVGPYYPDFVYRERHLIVEVDGGQHSENVADRERDGLLTGLGYQIIRIWNNQIFENIEGVLQMLRSELEKAPHPAPLPASGARERCTPAS